MKNKTTKALILLVLPVFCLSCISEYKKELKRIPETAIDTWIMTSMDSIGAYIDSVPCHSVNLYMAQGEVEHFKMAIKVSTQGTLAIERIPEQESDITFQARNVVVWNSAEDVLVPVDDNTIPVINDVKLWITYSTTEKTRQGVYNDILKFAGSAGEYWVKVQIQVYDCAIPMIPSIPAVFGINPRRLGIDSLSPEEASAVKKEWSDLLLDYRISPYFSEWINGTMKVENISSPWAWNDMRTINYLKNSRFNRIAMPCHSLNDEELTSMIGLLNSNGLLEKAYFYVWDEPKNMAEYAEVKKASERLHRIDSNAEVITSFFCGPQDGGRKEDLFAVFEILRGATTLFCTGVWSLRGSEQRADSCREAVYGDEEWWTYVCMSDSPGLSIENNNRIQNRAVLWRSYKEQSKGFLYWVVNSFDSLTPLIPRKDLPHGDGILMLPGKEFGFENGIVVSERLERWRDGAEDYELMKLLEEKKGRAVVLDILKQVYQTPLSQTFDSKSVIEYKKQLLEELTSN